MTLDLKNHKKRVACFGGRPGQGPSALSTCTNRVLPAIMVAVCTLLFTDDGGDFFIRDWTTRSTESPPTGSCTDAMA